MEFLLENILNLIGFIVGIIIGVFAYVGYKNTGSPVLFRLTIAFIAIGIGFGIILGGYVIDDVFLQEGHQFFFLTYFGFLLLEHCHKSEGAS